MNSSNMVVVFREKRLHDLLEKEAGNYPLAVRLVAFQLASGQASLEDISETFSSKCESEVRSEEDVKAAGHVHVRGYFHLVRYALETLSGSGQRKALCYCLSLLPPHGTPSAFVELVGLHLGMQRPSTIAALQDISNTGLINATGGKVEMHRVIQQHVRAALTNTTIRSSSVLATYQALWRVAKCLMCDYSSTREGGGYHSDSILCLKKLENKRTWLQFESAIESFLSFSEEVGFNWIMYIDLSLCWLHWPTPFDHSDQRKKRRRQIYAKINSAIQPHVDDLLSSTSSGDFSPSIWMAMLDNVHCEDWTSFAAVLITRHPRTTLSYINHLNGFIRTLMAMMLHEETIRLLSFLGETVPRLMSLYHQTKNEKICLTLGLIGDVYRCLHAFESAEQALLSMVLVFRNNREEQCGMRYNVVMSLHCLGGSYSNLLEEHLTFDTAANLAHHRKFMFWCEFAFKLCDVGTKERARSELMPTLAFCIVRLVLKTLSWYQPLMVKTRLVKLWLSRLFFIADKTSDFTDGEIHDFVRASSSAVICIFSVDGTDSFEYFAYTMGRIHDIAEKHSAVHYLHHNAPIVGLFYSWLKGDRNSSVIFAQQFLIWLTLRFERRRAHKKATLAQSNRQKSPAVPTLIDGFLTLVNTTKKQPNACLVFFTEFTQHVQTVVKSCFDDIVLEPSGKRLTACIHTQSKCDIEKLNSTKELVGICTSIVSQFLATHTQQLPE